MTPDIAARVIETVSEQLNIEADKISVEATFKTDLAAESAALLELALAFEETFGIKLSDDDTDQMHTVGDAARLIEQRTSK